jgi:hypothetical protein
MPYLDVFGFIPKRLERPHPELVHWWLLVHSSRYRMKKNETCSTTDEKEGSMTFI